MSEDIKKPSIKARQKARRAALQALYQWHLTEQPIDEIVSQFLQQPEYARIDADYFQELTQGVVLHVAPIDDVMTPALDRALSELNPVELLVLRLAIYELQHRLDIPYRVVINEALNVTKAFGAEQSYKYVNGVLDALVKTLRPHDR